MNLITLPVVDSTNSHALRLFEEGLAKEGTVVLAWEQTSGRGQRGSSWSSQAGAGLYFSMILTPPPGILHKVSVIVKALALGVLDFIREKTDSDTFLKWPNDILIGERKVCGMLLESVIRADQLSAIILGVGINLNHKSFPEGFRREAVSLHQITGKFYDPEEEVSHVVRSIMKSYRNFISNSSAEIDSRYHSALYGQGEICSFILNGEGIQAEFLGVNSNGEAVIFFEGSERNYPHPFLQLTHSGT